LKISTIKDLLEAELIVGEEFLDHEVVSACGSDLMSDVLTFVKEQTVLLTGLNNPQVIRTAEMLDVSCIVFVRGKKPTQDIINMALERDIVLLSTDNTLFEACGKLYEGGLRGDMR
jgi:predicted transcriptional regulator